MQNWFIKKKLPSALFSRTHVQNNNKLATLKRSVRLNMQRLKEERDEALNASLDNNTMENIEELEKLRQTLEYKIGDVLDIGEEQDMLIGEIEGYATAFE